MDPFKDPFVWTAHTLLGQKDLLYALHPILVIDALIKSFCGRPSVGGYVGFASVVFVDRFAEPGRPKVAGCHHRRLPPSTWASPQNYCDVDGFVNQHLRDEVETLGRLVRRSVPDHAEPGRMHATTLLALAGAEPGAEGGLLRRVYDFEDLEVRVGYKDFLVAWYASAGSTVLVLLRRFEAPTGHPVQEEGLDQPAFGPDAVELFGTMRVGPEDDNPFTRIRPHHVQPLLAPREEFVRNLAILGHTDSTTSNWPRSESTDFLSRMRCSLRMSSPSRSLLFGSVRSWSTSFSSRGDTDESARWPGTTEISPPKRPSGVTATRAAGTFDR